MIVNNPKFYGGVQRSPRARRRHLEGQLPDHRRAHLSPDRTNAEAIFISHTNLPTYDLIEPLETALGNRC